MDKPKGTVDGWDGTIPTPDEYLASSGRLIRESLEQGDGEMLYDVKVLMDAFSAMKEGMKTR